LKVLLGSGISIAAAAALANPLEPIVKPVLDALNPGEDLADRPDQPHWGMVIDLSKCIGCEYCVYACQATNDVPDDMRWNVHLVDQTPTGDTFHVTRPCLHCVNAPCVNVCPVTATYHRADGLVMMDYNKCIGCRYCQAACPYGARSFNWEARDDSANPYAPEWGSPEVERRPRGVVEKCTFCVHRIDPGLERGLTPGVDREATPACVNACPVDARHFGDLNDPNSPVSRIIASTPTFRLREDLGTEASVYYIPPEGLAI
jgi:Fe-S-cluster-containing dehydrogenase component